MKLEKLTAALRTHVDAKKPWRSARSAEDRLADCRSVAYQEMTVTAWERYLQESVSAAREKVVEEVSQSTLPAADKAHLARQTLK